MTALSEWIAANQETAWSAVQTDPKWAWIKSIAAAPGELAPLVERMGWETEAEAELACSLLNLSVGRVPVSGALSFDHGDLQTVGWYEMRADLSQASIGSGVTIAGDTENADASYGLLTMAQINEVARKIPSAGFDFVTELLDCDDFCDIAQGWLAEQGIGNAAIGTAVIKLYDNGTLVSVHAALLAVETDRDAWWIEPQNGQVYALNDFDYIRPGVDSAMVSDLFF